MTSLTLIGVGLIGGSFALDLKRQGAVQQVFGVDIDQENLTRALERKVIDQAMLKINTQAAGADFIVLATPVASIAQITADLSDKMGEKTILMDVGSTKQKTLNAFREHLPHHLPRCVAAHPIAGSDRSGALAARFGLFADKKVVLCPHECQDKTSLQRVRELWQYTDATIYEMSAANHDAIFSAVSHLPHLLAYALMHQISHQENHQELLHFAASGFRDFTRIAGSHPDIWADVCLANPEFIQAYLKDYIQELNDLNNMIKQQDRLALRQFFSEAKTARDQWQEQQ